MRFATVLVGCCLLAAACSGDASGITMQAREFQPKTFRVRVGEPISFDNKSEEGHTVTALEDELPEGAEYFASGGFANEEDARGDLAGGLIDPGESFEVTLDAPGTYRYVCLPHEDSGMTGTIVVEP